MIKWTSLTISISRYNNYKISTAIKYYLASLINNLTEKVLWKEDRGLRE